ncbi:Cytokinesis protein sepH [Porphyridium purpureum]|uniref:Cytokinesis protein sepH n=1 Tax=Porphyridium purpureum TaxID=35688 RepID=A0A5J4Z382_PORPP|nr:Cytokinesis protein sepH [Porphyridium purpureum]|eukprot:POR5958..scf295_1
MGLFGGARRKKQAAASAPAPVGQKSAFPHVTSRNNVVAASAAQENQAPSNSGGKTPRSGKSAVPAAATKAPSKRMGFAMKPQQAAAAANVPRAATRKSVLIDRKIALPAAKLQDKGQPTGNPRQPQPQPQQRPLAQAQLESSRSEPQIPALGSPRFLAEEATLPQCLAVLKRQMVGPEASERDKCICTAMITKLLAIAMTKSSGLANRIAALEVLLEMSKYEHAMPLFLDAKAIQATMAVLDECVGVVSTQVASVVVSIHRNLVTSSKNMAAHCGREGTIQGLMNVLQWCLEKDPALVALSSTMEQQHCKAAVLESVVIIAELASHGWKFQDALNKRTDGAIFSLLVRLLQHPVYGKDEEYLLHAVSALADFSSNLNWHHALMKAGFLSEILRILPGSIKTAVASESARILGNIAISETGRHILGKCGGAAALCKRAIRLIDQTMDEWQLQQSPSLDLVLAMRNMSDDARLCVSLLKHQGVVFLIHACISIRDAGDTRKNEAFATLLRICSSGDSDEQHRITAKVVAKMDELAHNCRDRNVDQSLLANLDDLKSLLVSELEDEAAARHEEPAEILSVARLIQRAPLKSKSAFKPSGKMLAIGRESAALDDKSGLDDWGDSATYQEKGAKRLGERPKLANGNGAHHHFNASPHGKKPLNQGEMYEIRRGSVSNRNDPGIVQLTDYLRALELKKQIQEKEAAENLKSEGVVSTPGVADGPENMRMSKELGELLEKDVFELGQELGRGGYGTVYLAKNLRSEELVAIKQFHKVGSVLECKCGPADAKAGQSNARKDPKQAEIKHHPLCGVDRKAFQELRIWNGLLHKNVVEYKGCFVGDQNDLNLVVEYVDGRSLAEHLAQFHAFPEPLVAEISTMVLEGLAYLHENGVTHRDLKPANIMVSASGIIKITDFGVSCASYAQTFASGDTMVGTPWYLAPEITKGQTYTSAVDIFSLGCTVLEIATGRRPYHDLPGMQVLFKMVEDEHPPVPDYLSSEIRDFLKKCWAADPQLRWTAKQLLRHPFLTKYRK